MIQQTIEKKILWGDMDPAGIVYYPRYYQWMDGATHQFFENNSLNLNSLMLERNIQFALAETACEYFSPGGYHQIILINTHIEQMDKHTVTLRHNITEKDDGRILVNGMEKRICLEIQAPGKMMAIEIPPDIRELLNKAFPKF